ncbi:hypothetical protein [Mycobacterium conspicuum]|uniref:Uncharacterized protein n=1 Tax=Mycobacterium conspicuum TaxID=44010 RepID=A0A7I7YID8_9MYCO|nr:hypothetical protein [Mycobacterium conspicuum]BBZ41147.1 hypothetical protein MCNS_42100 [Mycobacterium conspicuum]
MEIVYDSEGDWHVVYEPGELPEQDESLEEQITRLRNVLPPPIFQPPRDK